MSKHTPGPWRVSSDGAGFEVESEGGAVVAQAQQTKPVRCKSDNDARRANARLIAAAPLMYEALEGLMGNPSIDLGDLVYYVREREGKGWDGPDVNAWSNAVQLARAALQAAKGGGDGNGL